MSERAEASKSGVDATYDLDKIGYAAHKLMLRETYDEGFHRSWAETSEGEQHFAADVPMELSIASGTSREDALRFLHECIGVLEDLLELSETQVLTDDGETICVSGLHPTRRDLHNMKPFVVPKREDDLPF